MKTLIALSIVSLLTLSGCTNTIATIALQNPLTGEQEYRDHSSRKGMWATNGTRLAAVADGVPRKNLIYEPYPAWQALAKIAMVTECTAGSYSGTIAITCGDKGQEFSVESVTLKSGAPNGFIAVAHNHDQKLILDLSGNPASEFNEVERKSADQIKRIR